MSAWIVSPNHIRELVHGMVMYGVIEPDEADQTCDTLNKENHRSVNYRYGERKRAYSVGYAPVITDAEKHPEAYAMLLMKMGHCYNYQTCERPDYEKSRAFRLWNELETKLLEQMRRPYSVINQTPQYQCMPWGFTDIGQWEEALNNFYQVHNA